MPAALGAAIWKTGCRPDAAATACAWMFFIARFCLPVCSSCSCRCAGGCKYLHGGFVRWHFPCKHCTLLIITSCARGDTICLCPLQVDNIFTLIHQVAVLFRHNNNFVFIHQAAPVPACWLFKTSATSWPLTFWPWKWCPSHMWHGLPLCQF